MVKEKKMDAEIAQGPIGSVGKYDVAFKDGQLVVEVDASLGASSAGLIVKVDAAQILDALTAAIPGTIDDAIVGVIKAALLKI
jgi:hypothetical protein